MSVAGCDSCGGKSSSKFQELLEQAKTWTKEFKDRNGQELKPGDEVTFGEKGNVGTILGMENERILVKSADLLPGKYKDTTVWYIYMFPSVQATLFKKNEGQA